MARLRAARPEQGRRSPVRRARGIALAAGLAAAAALVWVAAVPKAASSGPAAPTASSPDSAPPFAAEGGEIFLPVELRQQVVHAEASDLIHLPDQPPFRLVRVVWRDDLTAVAAADDAALELSGYRETYIPVVATVY